MAREYNSILVLYSWYTKRDKCQAVIDGARLTAWICPTGWASGGFLGGVAPVAPTFYLDMFRSVVKC